MAVSAADVKALRERTGAGMMDCKAALEAAGGRIEDAITYLREKGLAVAAKRSGRVAAEGTIVVRHPGPASGILLELNCETDFVAKTPQFAELADLIASAVEQAPGLRGVGDAESFGIAGLPAGAGRTVADAVADRVASMGENVVVRRAARFEPGEAQGVVASYVHGGGKIGVLVEARTGASGGAREQVIALLRDLAMQIAAANPRWTRREEVPAAELERERGIFRTQALESGKPAPVIERIVAGKVEKFYGEACLLEQPFIRDGDKTVGKLVEEAVGKIGTPIEIAACVRFPLGESAAEA